MLSKVSRTLAIFKRRMYLKNRSFSIISNTCIGGVITNSVGEQFRSPTVNLVIYEQEFLTFCRHLKEYSQCDLDAPTEAEVLERYQSLAYPVGILRGEKMGLPDITVYFVHYQTFDQARTAWVKRFSRVNYDDIFLLMDRGMDATEDILDQFHALPYPNKVFFTHREDPARWPNTFRFSCYAPGIYQNAYLYTLVQKGLLQYRVLDEFDYVHWLNTGDIRRSHVFD